MMGNARDIKTFSSAFHAPLASALYFPFSGVKRGSEFFDESSMSYKGKRKQNLQRGNDAGVFGLVGRMRRGCNVINDLEHVLYPVCAAKPLSSSVLVVAIAQHTKNKHHNGF